MIATGFKHTVKLQTTLAEKIFIGESGRLIVDITETPYFLNKEGFLVTMDIEKAYDSLDRTFVISVLKKFGFSRGKRTNLMHFLNTSVKHKSYSQKFLIVPEKNFLCSRMNADQRVIHKWHPGVPQCSIWVSFLIYVNNIPSDLRSECKLFSDETSLFSLAHDVSTSVKYFYF